jgi:hypothetical protein
MLGKFCRIVVVSALCFLGLSCAIFDSGRPWKDGHYMLLWIDEPKEVTLSYDWGSGSSEPLVPSQVFAVGANGKFIVVKQHPGGTKSIVNFYVIPRRQSENRRTPHPAIYGPMTLTEFTKMTKELGLPGFSKTLTALE